jgi:hypothetical protein
MAAWARYAALINGVVLSLVQQSLFDRQIVDTRRVLPYSPD